MPNIKQYSTQFATKLAYIVTDILNLSEGGVISSISTIVREKDSTSKNWLFNAKLPREPKRLSISDALGVSDEYLFNDDVDIRDISKPRVIKRETCFWIPVVPEKDIFIMHESTVYPIVDRIPLMFPSFEKIISQYGAKIYATKVDAAYEPYIDHGATIIYTDTFIPDEYKFVLVKSGSGIELKRIIRLDSGQIKLSSFHDDSEVIENIEDKSKLFLIVLSFSI